MHTQLLGWINSNSKRFPNPQQNAYQQNLGSITASFNLQETIAYNLELGSKVFICTLDTKQAFDSLWLAGIFYKVHKFGIQGKAWRLITNAHTDMQSCIYVNGVKSDWFPVNQGVRQGGILSTLIYYLLIDGLLDELEHSNLGTYILDYKAVLWTLSNIYPNNLQKCLI